MRIRCTNKHHVDNRASMWLYEDAGYCFSCGHLDRSVSDVNSTRHVYRDEIEDGLSYIESLPRKEIRGLELPYDNTGYYIVGPNTPFYKKRLYDEQFGKYRIPVGNSIPLWINSKNLRTPVLIVEGELNAMSLNMVCPDRLIVSPGSVTNFGKYLKEYLTLGNEFVIIVDNDRAGIEEGVKLRDKLLKLRKRATLVTCEKDINQILQDEGEEGVKRWAEK